MNPLFNNPVKLLFWFGNTMREIGMLLFTFGVLDLLLAERDIGIRATPVLKHLFVISAVFVFIGIICQWRFDPEQPSEKIKDKARLEAARLAK